MKIERFILGSYQTNSYLLKVDRESEDCLIIDAGLEPRPLTDYLAQNRLNPLAILLTHGHADHIAGINTLRQNFDKIKVAVHKADAKMLTTPEENLSFLAGVSVTAGSPDIILEDETIIEFADIKLKVLHTPGHTPGGICLHCRQENLVFTGDTLFAESVGRTDLAGGNPETAHQQLITSIKEKLLPLPEETTAYPGHGSQTTIAREKKYNPFLKTSA